MGGRPKRRVKKSTTTVAVERRTLEVVETTTGNLAAALAVSDVAGNGSPLPAGDFVRWCRQVLDLLDQVRNAAPESSVRTAAKRAIDDIRRGVVAVDNG